MTKRLAVIVTSLVVGLLSSGCSSTCEKLDSSLKSFETKAKPCASGDGSMGTTKFDVAKCETGLKSCTSDEQKKFATLADCLDKLSTCEKGKEKEFQNAALACIIPIITVSEKCQKGFSEATK